MDEYLAVSSSECKPSPNDCKQPNSFAYLKCLYLSECELIAPKIRLDSCNQQISNYLHVEYQCIPVNSTLIRSHSCRNFVPSFQNYPNGFIVSPGYPTYDANSHECYNTAKPRDGYGYKVYIVDIALSNYNDSKCIDDYVEINQIRLCSSIGPTLFYNGKINEEIKISYESFKNENSNTSGLKGFKIYFEEYQQKILTTSTRVSITTTEEVKHHKHVSSEWIYIGICVAIGCFIIVITVFAIIRRRLSIRNQSKEAVSYVKNPNFRN